MDKGVRCQIPQIRLIHSGLGNVIDRPAPENGVGLRHFLIQQRFLAGLNFRYLSRNPRIRRHRRQIRFIQQFPGCFRLFLLIKGQRHFPQLRQAGSCLYDQHAVFLCIFQRVAVAVDDHVQFILICSGERPGQLSAGAVHHALVPQMADCHDGVHIL